MYTCAQVHATFLARSSLGWNAKVAVSLFLHLSSVFPAPVLFQLFFTVALKFLIWQVILIYLLKLYMCTWEVMRSNHRIVWSTENCKTTTPTILGYFSSEFIWKLSLEGILHVCVCLHCKCDGHNKDQCLFLLMFEILNHLTSVFCLPLQKEVYQTPGMRSTVHQSLKTLREEIPLQWKLWVFPLAPFLVLQPSLTFVPCHAAT